MFLVHEFLCTIYIIFSHYMSILQELIPEIIPSKKCHTNIYISLVKLVAIVILWLQIIIQISVVLSSNLNCFSIDGTSDH